MIGKWFERTGKRDQIFLATKFGYVEHSKTFETDSSAAYCKKACERSLEKLGIDTIDLCESPTFVQSMEGSIYGYGKLK